MLTDAFEIRHDWGDPREPEYKNGYMVSRAYYREGEVHLFFSMYPEDSSDHATMVLEVPGKIRMSFANDWRQCETAIRRVIDFLATIDESTSHRRYRSIVVDTSKVSGWLPTQIELFEKNFTYLNDTLPSARTVPFIVLGAVIAFQSRFRPFDFPSTELTNQMLMADGVLILGLLLRDVYMRWMFFVRSPTFYKWTLRDTVKGTFKRYGRRYLVTLCISVLLIGGGLK